MIEFNIPPCGKNSFTYMEDAVKRHKICGDGPYTKRCQNWASQRFDIPYAYLTPSGTASLEMGAVLSGIGPGDEVILPSYTFCSTADAFVQRGATLVFVDIRPDTMNIDETRIEDAITEKTKVLAPIDYAGVASEMDTIMDIAKRHHLLVVEDAAQGFGSYYKGRPLGTLADFSCFSFHETKNFSMGEGGMFCFSDEKWREAAEMCREKGTDRSKFFRGEIDKYTWRQYGSSYLASDLGAAYLMGQLDMYEEIFSDRMASWSAYHEAFQDLEEAGYLTRPVIPAHCAHNAHMYYIKLANEEVRSRLIAHLRQREIMSVFHYIPLHSSPAGQRYGRFAGEDRYTTSESLRLLRLPLYYGLTREDHEKVITAVTDFFQRRTF